MIPARSSSLSVSSASRFSWYVSGSGLCFTFLRIRRQLTSNDFKTRLIVCLLTSRPNLSRMQAPILLRFFGNSFGPRSWRRPLPAATLRRKNTSRQEEQGVQGLRPLSLQCLYKFIINHNKVYHLYNCLIFLLFL